MELFIGSLVEAMIFIFEHDGSLRAIIDLLQITAPLSQNEEVF